MENNDSATSELVQSAENELKHTDCVTPAFLCQDKNGDESVKCGGLDTFRKLKELWYKIVKVFIPDI